MLTGIHILLTYRCTYECDHCFVFGSPSAKGTFTLAQIRQLLDEAVKIGTVKTIFFEGGEAFLFYPLLTEGVRLAREAGFDVGIVTNAYFATTVEDAILWLQPLAELGISLLTISDDSFHSAKEDNPARRAAAAATQLGIPTGTICVGQPSARSDQNRARGEPMVGGGVMFKGRAAEKLIEGLPRVAWQEFSKCPHEDLADPGRVHVDAYGHVHLCQGLSVGNAWQTPLSTLIEHHEAAEHPVAGPILRGGPAELVRVFDLPHESAYVDACHLCYLARKALLDRFPELLAPRQLYGLL